MQPRNDNAAGSVWPQNSPSTPPKKTLGRRRRRWSFFRFGWTNGVREDLYLLSNTGIYFMPIHTRRLKILIDSDNVRWGVSPSVLLHYCSQAPVLAPEAPRGPPAVAKAIDAVGQFGSFGSVRISRFRRIATKASEMKRLTEAWISANRWLTVICIGQLFVFLYCPKVAGSFLFF